MNWPRSLIGLAVALPILGLLVYGLTVDPRQLPSTLPGKPAPDFVLRTLDTNETVRLAEQRGNIVVLNVWASWCLPCRTEHPELSAAARLYTGQPVRFYGLLYQDNPDNARAWLRELGQDYPSLVDDGTRTSIDYGVTGVPETFVIDDLGHVRYKKLGPITRAELRRIIDPLVGEIPARTASDLDDVQDR